MVAAALGVGEFFKAGRADKAVRATVLKVAPENGLEDAASRLSRPVIKVEAGVWVVIAAGVSGAAIAAISGWSGAAEE
jgi:hypothetical protein